MQRVSDIGAPSLLSASSSPSLNGLADTDSESAIFSSGLLALFYLCSLVRARLFLPLTSRYAEIARLLAFLSPCAHLFLSFTSSSPSHSQPDPDLRLRPGQRRSFDSRPVRANGNLFKMADNLQCHNEFFIRFCFFI